MSARGESTFRANGREVTVLFTNRALAGAEQRLKKGIIGISQGLLNGETGLTEIAVLLQVGMEAARVDARAGGRQVSLDDAYKVLDDAGFAAVAAPVLMAVAEVLSYAAGEDAIEGQAGTDGTDPNV